MIETANDKLSLNTILSRLQNAADDIEVTNIQWAINDLLFNFCTESFDKFNDFIH